MKVNIFEKQTILVQNNENCNYLIWLIFYCFKNVCKILNHGYHNYKMAKYKQLHYSETEKLK